MGSREGACHRELSEEEWVLLQSTLGRSRFCLSCHGVGRKSVLENLCSRKGFCSNIPLEQEEVL